jgi:hypothetical protein
MQSTQKAHEYGRHQVSTDSRKELGCMFPSQGLGHLDQPKFQSENSNNV